VRTRQIAIIATAAALAGAAVAYAAHPKVDPASVPTGFLAAHSQMDAVPATALRRIVRNGRVDAFLEHVRLAPGEQRPFVTHPGPVLVMIASGEVRNTEAGGGACRTRRYVPDRGFVTRGIRKPHALGAGPDGADAYLLYLAPRRTGPTQTVVDAPAAC
jgi:hypothetical protein